MGQESHGISDPNLETAVWDEKGKCKEKEEEESNLKKKKKRKVEDNAPPNWNPNCRASKWAKAGSTQSRGM